MFTIPWLDCSMLCPLVSTDLHLVKSSALAPAFAKVRRKPRLEWAVGVGWDVVSELIEFGDLLFRDKGGG